VLIKLLINAFLVLTNHDYIFGFLQTVSSELPVQVLCLSWSSLAGFWLVAGWFVVGCLCLSSCLSPCWCLCPCCCQTL